MNNIRAFTKVFCHARANAWDDMHTPNHPRPISGQTLRSGTLLRPLRAASQDAVAALNGPVLDDLAGFAADKHREAREPRGAMADPPRCIPAALLATGGGAAGDQLRAVDALADRFRQQVPCDS